MTDLKSVADNLMAEPVAIKEPFQLAIMSYLATLDGRLASVERHFSHAKTEWCGTYDTIWRKGIPKWFIDQLPPTRGIIGFIQTWRRFDNVPEILSIERDAEGLQLAHRERTRVGDDRWYPALNFAHYSIDTLCDGADARLVGYNASCSLEEVAPYYFGDMVSFDAARAEWRDGVHLDIRVDESSGDDGSIITHLAVREKFTKAFINIFPVIRLKGFAFLAPTGPSPKYDWLRFEPGKPPFVATTNIQLSMFQFAPVFSKWPEAKPEFKEEPCEIEDQSDG